MTKLAAFLGYEASNTRKSAFSRRVLSQSSSLCHFLQTLSPLSHQMRSDDEEVGERAGGKEAVRVFVETAVAHLGEAEHTLDHAEHMLDFGAHLRLRAVLGSLNFVHAVFKPIASIGEVERVGRVLSDNLRLPLIGAIPPDPCFIPMQQIGQDHRISDVGRSGDHRVVTLFLLSTPMCAFM